MMVGRLLSFSDGISSGVMLNFQGVLKKSRLVTYICFLKNSESRAGDFSKKTSFGTFSSVGRIDPAFDWLIGFEFG